MGSKYDKFWKRKLDDIKDLIREAVKEGRSREIDVGGLTDLGNRQDWYGSIIFDAHRILTKSTPMAHVKSLVNVIRQSGILKGFEGYAFRAVVNSKLKCHFELIGSTDSESGDNIIKRRDNYFDVAVKFQGVKNTTNIDMTELCAEVHNLLESLPLFKHDYNSSEIPLNGVYFFYEKGEVCKRCGRVGAPRIVRVGTHEKDDRLRKRLRFHFRGDKSSSIFRKNIGRAILKKEGASDFKIRQWNRNEIEMDDIEEKVSDALKENFSFRVIRIDDRNDRLQIEGFMIALISMCSKECISDNWLGLFSPIEEIKTSGLWNKQGVGDVPSNIDEMMDKFRRYVDLTKQHFNYSDK
ncbi:MAG: hypothetical protein J7L07_01220 [Candidatus Odinarchaeota archaeon]|nr:hypothetical protein [Candidatus Odinarchaeota archaeon]